MSCSENTSGSCLGWSFAVPSSCISAEASIDQQVGTGCAQAAHVSASLHHFVLWEPGWSSPVWNGFRFVCSELGSFAASTGRKSSLKEEMIVVDVEIAADCL